VSFVITERQFDFAKRLLERRYFEVTEKIENAEAGIVDIHARSTRKGDKRTLLLRIVEDTATVVGVEILRSCIKARDEGGFAQAILIGGERYTYAARREAKLKDIELLHRRFLSIDLFMHELVPEHTIITEDEVKEIEAKYGIARMQLPKIKAGDPAAKAIGARPGDVVQIIRKSATAGTHTVYRICVP
jgi:DNA-directed RNA polymerase subunit H